MNKKSLLRAVLLSTILFTGVAGTTLVNLGKANPTKYYFPVSKGRVAPDQYTRPPTISILPIENDTVYAEDAITLSLKVNVGDSSTASSLYIHWIYYEVDWQPNITAVYNATKYAQDYLSPPRNTEFSKTINVTGIPDGNHTLMVYAIENGRYELYEKQVNVFWYECYYNTFRITGSSFVRFSVDTAPPVVSVFSPENLTCYSPEVQLNFTVTEPVSKMAYSLDGNDNVTVVSNSTLTGLSAGEHTIKVCAWDEAGNVGASETVTFTVAPFPSTPVVASVASVAIVSVALLVYFKKRKH